MATRPGHEHIGFGLVSTCTSHLESLTVRSGSQSDQNDRVKKVPSTLFCAPLGAPIRPFVRSLEAISHWFSIRTGPGSAENGSVAYQVAKVEMSNFSAVELSPGGVSQNHTTDFLKTVPTRNLRGGTRHMSSGHEVRRHTPSATASTYESPQSNK